MTQTKTKGKSASRLGFRMVVPLFCGGMLILGAGMVIKRSLPNQQTESSVRADIIQTIKEGGWLGPFNVSAESFESATTEFINFEATSDDFQIVASRAKPKINISLNTISIILTDVLINAIPQKDGIEYGPPTEIEKYILGPFPYKIDIIADPIRSNSKEKSYSVRGDIANISSDDE